MAAACPGAEGSVAATGALRRSTTCYRGQGEGGRWTRGESCRRVGGCHGVSEQVHYLIRGGKWGEGGGEYAAERGGDGSSLPWCRGVGSCDGSRGKERYLLQGTGWGGGSKLLRGGSAARMREL